MPKEQRFCSREGAGITEFLLDTTKIRTLKLFSNASKNGGLSNVLSSYEVFILSPTVLEWIKLIKW